MKYDIVIIGSGPGGYVAAIRAAQLGKKTAIVERDALGGVCLNRGCIPTKALLKSAQVWTYVKHAAKYGVKVEGEASPSLAEMVDRAREVASTMSRGVDFLLKKHGVEIIPGRGSLDGDGRVIVDRPDGTAEALEADAIILATGSRPRQMDFMPIDGRRILSSTDALLLKEMPGSIAIVGSGAIGSEFAYFYASLGVKVTLIEYLPSVLPLADEEASKTIERAFRKLGMTVMTSASVKSVDISSGDKCRLEAETRQGLRTLETDLVLSAVGIKSNIENIGLEKAGIIPERDKIPVDRYYRTSAPGIYAIGDIVAGPALAHAASAEAICCVEKICGLEPQPVDYSSVPSCVYTEPEVASVGLTEREAVAAGYELKIGRFPFTASGRATAAGERDGFVKLIFNAADEKLLGAHMVGAGVTEVLGEAVMAKNLEGTIHRIASTVHAHPTMSEAVMEAAEAALGRAIHLV